ncbi:patatin-like phospholipase family protein [Peredibacter sp. HCB2-198]|uniref:patatin-like phospholipase family protein n=1 Tax=Peredibacter sp. HCB2-198 TaxID=3383025 RepID=UPI0038B42644
MKWPILFLLLFSINAVASEKLAFTLSGGVSLGSYEAGVFYQLLQKDKASITRNTKVVFGASAGSINGLFGILDMCGFRDTKREQSLLWKMWIPIGLDQLESKDEKVFSLLERKAIKPLFAEARERWKEGLSEECDIIYGAAVTRRTPLVEEFKPGLEIVRQPEFFMVRIKGRGKGQYPLVENYQTEGLQQFRTYLPLGASPQKDISILLDLIQASSAFPGAFTPYLVEFCLLRPGEVFKKCDSSNTQSELFIDGGIYHNGPVGYAYEVLDKLTPGKDYTVYYLNASAPLVAKKNVEQVKRKDEGVIQDFYHLLIDFTVQARKFELSKSLEAKPGLGKHIKTNPKNYPLVSEPLYAFLGFVEEDFRISDFYLGMNDADSLNPKKADTEDHTYQCFKQHLHKEQKCTLDSNLKILSDLAVYRKNTPITDKPDFDVVFDYLENHDFEFKDLGLDKDQSHYGKVYLKERLNKMLNVLVKKQPEAQHQKLTFITRPALNFLRYTPPKDYWSALYASSPEVGYSRVIPTDSFRTASYRHSYHLMFNGMSSFFNRAQDIWALTPLVGIEYEPVNLNSAVVQWHIGSRLGYILADRDSVGTKPCDADLAEVSSAACSGVTLHLTAAVSFFELVRLQFVYVPLVVDQLAFNPSPELMLQIGFQFDGSMLK